MKLYRVEDNSINGMGPVADLLSHFFPFAQEKLGFHKPVMISFQSDKENASKLLGKTAHYDPQNYSIAVYVDGRHPKDVMRSISHELVHHAQNCNGDFNLLNNVSQGYAQNDETLRKAELDAYKRGNIIFRDFEDLIKKGEITVNIDFTKSGEPKMSLKEWKNNELNMLLMKKWGLLKEEAGHPGKSCKETHPGQPHSVDEGCPPDGGGEALNISGPGMEVHVDDISQLEPEEAFGAGIAAARDAIDDLIGGGDDTPPEEEEALQERNKQRDEGFMGLKGPGEIIKDDPGIQAVKGAAAAALPGALGLPARDEDEDDDDDIEENFLKLGRGAKGRSPEEKVSASSPERLAFEKSKPPAGETEEEAGEGRRKIKRGRSTSARDINPYGVKFEENRTLSIDEAKDLARRIFEKINGARK